MMTATSAFAVNWIWLLVLTAGGALPLGGAPLQLDPALSAIAPEDCLWYAAYAGQGPADPKSGNRTEQLFAEPQIRQFARQIEDQLTAALRRAAGPEQKGQVFAESLPKLLKAVLLRPFALYVEEVKPRVGGVDVEAAFLLNAGDQKAELESALNRLVQLHEAEKQPLPVEDAAGIQWRRFPTPSDAPPVRLGWKDNYLILAVGQTTPVNLIKRMDGQAPKWLAEIREEHPVERELSIGYLNVAGILKRVQPHLQAKEPKAWDAINRLGLTSIQAIHGVSGYDKEASVTMAHLVTDGARPGILGLLPHEPLAAEDLEIVPKDALLALAVRIDAAATRDNFIDLVAQFHPKAREDVDRAAWHIQNTLGVNIRQDILAPLGDRLVIYLPAGDILTAWPNATVAVRVDDVDKLRDKFDQLMDAAKLKLAQQPRAEASIGSSRLGEATMYSLRFNGPAPVAPAWCVGDKWFVAGLSPQAVRSALERKAEDSLAASPVVKEALNGDNGAAVLAYQDTPALVRSVYPWVQIGLQVATGALRQHGLDIDTSSFPSLDAIVKHLEPDVCVVVHRDDGFHLTARHSLPGQGNFAAAAPIAVAVMLPAVRQAKMAAAGAEDLNKLKQLALGFHNYTDSHRYFPTDVYSKDGKPLLSWRVKLLPYLEESTMSEKFKLDEPWDSEHNRQLLDKMPAIYRSAGDPEGTNKTRFVALKGPDTLFPGQKQLSFKHITDGTSNTLMFVQAQPANAVEWSKPADLAYNAEKPFAGLESPEGSFLATFCDGSARRLSLAIGADMMRALVTRAGDEVVSHEQLDAPPGQPEPQFPVPVPELEPVEPTEPAEPALPQ